MTNTFKDLFLLDPNIIFLNHGSFGACPRPVFTTYQAWQLQLESEPVQFLGVKLDGFLHEAREKLGEYLHTSASNLVFIPNATHGVNIIARSIQLNPGEEIVATDQEYGACRYTWEFNCEKTGAIYKPQPIQLPVFSEDQIIDALWCGVTPQTRVIYLSHITSPTALRLPVEAICKRAREDGIITVIDGAHAPGQIPVDLDALQADFYTGNCHKWMLSPKGAAFLYARPEVQPLIEPLVVSWGYQSRFTSPRESRFIDYLQWSGTKDPAASLSVPAAIDFMAIHDWVTIRNSCHALLKNAITQISDMTGILPIAPLDSNFYAQMAAVPIPQVKDITVLKDRLFSEYKIEIPVIEWENKHFIRISVQAYNTREEIDNLVAALYKLLPELQMR